MNQAEILYHTNQLYPKDHLKNVNLSSNIATWSLMDHISGSRVILNHQALLRRDQERLVTFYFTELCPDRCEKTRLT